MLGPLIKNAPVIGSCYGFATTAVKGVVIDCTPPIIKYPALCAALATCCFASYVTGGNPLVVSPTVTIGESIVESAL